MRFDSLIVRKKKWKKIAKYLVIWKNCHIFAPDFQTNGNHTYKYTCDCQRKITLEYRWLNIPTKAWCYGVWHCLSKVLHVVGVKINVLFDVLIDYRKTWNGWEYFSTTRCTCSTLWNAFGFVLLSIIYIIRCKTWRNVENEKKALMSVYNDNWNKH